MNHKPNISYFRIFSSKYFVLEDSPKIIIFDPKLIEWIFVGYSMTSKAYRVYISTSLIVVESAHVKFNEETNTWVDEGNIDFIGVEAPKLEENVTIHEQRGERVVEEK
jgi:hypothetical protein